MKKTATAPKTQPSPALANWLQRFKDAAEPITVTISVRGEDFGSFELSTVDSLLVEAYAIANDSEIWDMIHTLIKFAVSPDGEGVNLDCPSNDMCMALEMVRQVESEVRLPKPKPRPTPEQVLAEFKRTTAPKLNGTR